MLTPQEQRQRIAEELARIRRRQGGCGLGTGSAAASAAPLGASPSGRGTTGTGDIVANSALRSSSLPPDGTGELPVLPRRQPDTAEGQPEPIAIIGLAGYFPRCMSVAAFWQAVDQDRCLIEPTPQDRIALWSRSQRGLAECRGIQGGGFIPDIRSFDPAFFHLLPRQAHALDPRQRLLLMSVYHCFEDAGYNPHSLKQQPVGVFVGIEEDEYFPNMLEAGIRPTGGDGLSASMVANRISWSFDFRGPSEVVNTMCSGAAVALHRAVRSLRSQETSMAVVGGANLLLRPEPFLALAQNGQLSPDLAVRSFGKDANGFLRAEGVACILLKRLSQAETDCDPIYAVIRNTAVNYNGRGGMSIAAPDIAAHAELIERCYREAGIDPRAMRYLEAQGMGNPVADLGEWQALNRALSNLARARGVTLAPGTCRVGTLKPMIGHMHSASALGALFKVIRSFQTATIHKILGFAELNSELEDSSQPCVPARETEPWPSSGQPRLAGIHSYGAGGNNAHLLIQEYCDGTVSPKARRPRLTAQPFALRDCWYDHLQPHPTANVDASNAIAADQAEEIVRTLLSRYLEIPAAQVDLDAAFVDLGFNSPLVAELAAELRREHAITLEPARFFEFKTPRQLAVALTEFTVNATPGRVGERTADRIESSSGAPRACEPRSFTPIAIIGLAGRYPASPTVADFWENLRSGRDCISEIPTDRWLWAEHFDPNPETAAKGGKCYGKWGGFISGMNEFDPLFFKISPLEAESMNPKERLVLQTVWHTLEDAGHTPGSLATDRVGVFFGVTRAGWDPYPGTFSSVANRVSYFCDFHGPSVSIDTMCSSSLVAIHEACQHLQTGSCDVAVAGGVNLYLHPSHFVVLAHGRFLSPDGTCRAFGADANGMVPGEGVGAVLLKPLARALHDGDRIYGVIRGSASNHGGAANGYTVPNPVAQKELVLQALRTAGVNPRQISYVEAHGTGTSLGDPVEIRGLTEAYRQNTLDCGFCRIGSLKSNMGHLEAAAGIASVTKVLMQLQHREIAPSLHAAELNPSIDFAATPFVVQQVLEPWQPLDANGHSLLRLAAISSFGAGGSNAHLIVEEAPILKATGAKERPQIIVLSARNEERLREEARNLNDFIEAHPDTYFADLAYTLQVGRSEMEERLATVVDSLVQLRERLRSLEQNPKTVEGVYRGYVSARRNATDNVVSQRDGADTGSRQQGMNQHDLERFAQSWVNGGNIDWTQLYRAEKPNRIGLPLYPFACVVIPPLNLTLEPKSPRVSVHPLAQRNTSTLDTQRFTSTFTGQEFFLADHVVQRRKTLSAAACLEIARAAIEQSLPPQASNNGDGAVPAVRLRQVVWTRPLSVTDEPLDVHVVMKRNGSGPVSFEIQTISQADEGKVVVHAQGEAEPSFVASHEPGRPLTPSLSPSGGEGARRAGEGEPRHTVGMHVCERTAACAETVDLDAIRAEPSVQFSAEKCYAAFAELGIEYGPGHRAIKSLRVGDNQVLARLKLPASVQENAGLYVLHPSLIDAALQATIGFGLREGNLKPSLPYSIEEVEILLPCTPSMWGVVRRRVNLSRSDALQTFDLDLCDDQGTVRGRIKGFAARVLHPAITESEKPTLMLRVPQWEAQEPAHPEHTLPRYQQHAVVVCGLEPSVVGVLQADPQFQNVAWIQVTLKRKNLAKDYHDAVLKTFGAIRRILEAKPTGDALIQVLMGDHGADQAHSGLVGLLRTAHLESPRLHAQLIQAEAPLSPERLAEILKENAASLDDTWVRYHAGQREVATWIDHTFSYSVPPWKANGVYLITGGLGGLGRIFAEEITRRVSNATVVLIGRSRPGEDGLRFLRALKDRGVAADYRQVDLRNRDQVRECVQSIMATFGRLDGILHAAAVLRDQYLLRKSAKDIECVLGPKVTGTVNLDEATRDVPLDFFVLFSSGATLGNPAQGDYAAANGFLNGFARYRNEFVSAGTRRGVTVSVAWPYWKEGGMRMDATAQKLMHENTGLVAMETQTGLEAFYRCVASGQSHVLVLNGTSARHTVGSTGDSPAPLGDPPSGTGTTAVGRRVAESRTESSSLPLGESPVPPSPKKADAPNSVASEVELAAPLTEYLGRLIGETLKIESSEVKPDKDLYSYGLDSIIALEVNNRLEQDFARLSKTLFFEYSTIQELAGYFLQAHHETVQRMFAAPIMSATRPERLSVEPPNSLAPKPQPSNGTPRQPPAAPTLLPPLTSLRHEALHTPADALATASLNRPGNMDELIRTSRLEIVHPTPRSSNRLASAKDWPNWHSLFESFAIFDTIRPEFSFSRMLSGCSESSADATQYLEGQLELRRLLFHREDFCRVSNVVDLGCGHGADLIELALSHPDLLAQGLTTDVSEAEFANRMVRRQGLSARVWVTPEDNAAHEFETDFDLAFSIQVMHFIPELERKRTLFRKVAAALRPEGVLLMAEFVSLLAKPMRDSTLHTTVHCASEWATVLGENGLVLDEVIDLSTGIVNFLHDPALERHIVGLDTARQVEIRKYNRQVKGLANGWVSYCVLRVLKDHRQIGAEQRTRENLEHFNHRMFLQQVRANKTNGQFGALYQDVLEHFRHCVATPAPLFPAEFSPAH